MNLVLLVWSYLRARPLNTLLNVMLLSTGVAVITLLIVANNQLRHKIESNARGIDLVVGAKGSPLQLILCNIFHVDFPTGNIKLWEAERIARNRLVSKAIPLALGDSHQGFRIIGTSKAYADLYDAKLYTGQWWQKPMEVTIGSQVAKTLELGVGARFTSNHGLTAEGHAHEEQSFIVSGILADSHTILDNLILTQVESIWMVHSTHPAPEGHDVGKDTGTSRLIPSVLSTDSAKEITSLLIRYRSAMGAVQLPRWVNGQSNLQAASPAFETARLFSIIGFGANIIRGFAYILIFISALSIFIALYNSLKERRYDLAVMRSMGASRVKIFSSVLMEGLLLTILGATLGLLAGHGILLILSAFIENADKAGISAFIFYREEWIILAGSLLLGLLCALIPAVQAYRTDISKVLASN